MVKRFIFFIVLVFIGLNSSAQASTCGTATNITIPGSGNICVNGSLAGGQTNGFYTTCESNGSTHVWYTFVSSGTSDTVTVSPGGGTPATNLSVMFTANGCGNNNISGCDSASTPGGSASVSQVFAAGTTIWVAVSSTVNSGGTFQLCITSVTAPASTGKTCQTAVPICSLNPFTVPVIIGSNGYRPSCFAQVLQDPTVFQFTVAQTGLCNWLATPTCGPPNAANTEFDWAMYDITGGCPGTQVACDYNYTAPGFGALGPPTTCPQGMQGPAGLGCNVGTNVTNCSAEQCTGVNVTAGRTYIIVVDQYTAGSSCSLSFSFAGSTFVLAPLDSFNVTPSHVCGNTGTVTFTNHSLGVATQKWYFGDGDSSTLANPGTHTYAQPGNYLVTLIDSSASGCVIVSSQSVVIQNPTVTVNSLTACPSQADTLTATVTGATGGTYSWSPIADTTQSINVAPVSTTTYTVTFTSPQNCTATGSGTITVVPGTFTVEAGNDTSMCANQTITLHGTVNPVGNYTYQWTPIASLTNANTLNPLASPADTTKYFLAVTNSTGCTVVDSMRVNVNGVALTITVTDSPSLVCPGQLVQLNANILPTACGIAPACPGLGTPSIVGNGNISQPGPGNTQPTILGNLAKSTRNQMLYTAAELTAALGGPCTIRSVGFDVNPFNSNAYLLNFTVSVACTNLSSLSSFDNNLVQVVNPITYQPVAGWNNFGFNNAFNWDGASNLIVDICWYDPTTFGNLNNKAVCTNTGANIEYLYSFGATDQCGTGAGAPTTSNLRPNVKIYSCQPSITNYHIAWVPNTGLNEVNNDSIPNPTTNPVATTNYTITVGTGTCAGIKTVTVQVDTSKVSAGPDINSCPNSAVHLTATVTGAPIPGPASFVWTTLAGVNVGNTQNVTVNPVASTTYVVTMNGGPCPKRDTVNVIIGGLVVTATPTNVTCNGSANGQINATSSNGVAPFTYNWSNATAVNPAINLAPGNYSVTMTDINGCSGSATATITQPSALTFTGAVTNATCFGGSDGSILLTPAGATPPYTYLWSDGHTVNNDAGLTAGPYSVTVKDAQLCTASAAYNVTQPTQITFGAATIQNVKCLNGNTGSITVAPTGGTGAYTYLWSNAPPSHAATASNLVAGSYTVTVTDANNCTATASYTVTQPANGITFNPPTITPPTCYGLSNGSATANNTGGTPPYTYLWTPSNQTTQTAINLSAQVYTVQVTDDSLCSATTTITIIQPAQIVITGTDTNVTCNGNSDGGVSINITNGVAPFTYAWSDGSSNQNLANVPAGTYRVTVTDNNSCVRSDTFTITQPTPFLLNAPNLTNITCFGASTGAATVNPSGGTTPYAYSWSNSATTQTISNLPAGTYSITVTDAKGCTDTTSYTLTQPASGMVFGQAVITNGLCNGQATGSITVSVTGGTPAYVYSWSQNPGLDNSTASGLAAGTYTVTVTDAKSCTISQTNIITQPVAITFGAQTVTNVTCFGGTNGSATITPGGGVGNFTYTWSGVPGPGTNPENNLGAGTYTVVVTDGNGCTASTSVIITQPAAFVTNLTPSNVKCFGGSDGSLMVTVTGGTGPYQYSWSNNQTTQTAMGLSAQLYSVTITDASGCTVSAAGTLSQPALPLSFVATPTQVKCPGDKNGTISVTASGGTPPYNFSATTDGSNFVYATNGIITGLDSGWYLVLVSDSNGCTTQDSTYVASPVPDYFTITVDSTSCFGPQYTDGAIHVTGTTNQNLPYEFALDSGSLQTSGDFYYVAAGRHVITAVNNFGCVSYLDTVVPQPAQATANVLPKDTTLQLGQTIQLTASFGPYSTSSITSYNWSPSTGLSCIDCPDPVVTSYNHVTEYVVIITYNNGCTVKDSMRLIIQNEPHYFVPNSFSPNGDGVNDKFEIYGEHIKTINLKIFNRWGEKVYDSENEFAGWDGTYKGVLQEPGVYVYEVLITFLDDTQLQKQGSITLVR